MIEDLGIVVVTIMRHEDGLYEATSPDLAGICVVHRDVQMILDDVPNMIRLWFKRHRDMAIEVFQGPVKRTDDLYTIPAVPVPAEIAARALAR
jgi:hypothetical protein